MDKSKSYKLIVLGQEDFFVEEVISIVSTRYSGSCVHLHSFNEVNEQFLHSIPPDGVIIQTGHPDYHLIYDFLRNNDLNVLLISFSPKDFIAKIDSYFSALKKWFSIVPFLPLNSNIAGFIGYTPVDLFVKNGTEFEIAISKKSFISNDGVKNFFKDGHGFFFIRREDRPDYEEDWGESTLAYFKSVSSPSITHNGPLGLVIPFYDSFLDRNSFTFASFTYDFGSLKPTFYVEENGLPQDLLLGEIVRKYAETNSCEVVETATIR